MTTSAEARPDAALSVPCLWYQCEAEPGERCRVEYGPLSRQPHPVRIKTAALVAAAEERGAAAERERIADEIADRQHDELAGVIPAAGSTTQAYDYARRVARGQS